MEHKPTAIIVTRKVGTCKTSIGFKRPDGLSEKEESRGPLL